MATDEERIKREERIRQEILGAVGRITPSQCHIPSTGLVAPTGFEPLGDYVPEQAATSVLHGDPGQRSREEPHRHPVANPSNMSRTLRTSSPPPCCSPTIHLIASGFTARCWSSASPHN
jgi:hypothetical protein